MGEIYTHVKICFELNLIPIPLLTNYSMYHKMMLKLISLPSARLKIMMIMLSALILTSSAMMQDSFTIDEFEKDSYEHVASFRPARPAGTRRNVRRNDAGKEAYNKRKRWNDTVGTCCEADSKDSELGRPSAVEEILAEEWYAEQKAWY